MLTGWIHGSYDEPCLHCEQGYKNCVDVGSRADGRFVNWAYREKLDKAARSGPKAKLEVAKVREGRKEGGRALMVLSITVCVWVVLPSGAGW